jgi:hypothetical protein
MERGLLDKAYRKLKGSVYLNKSLPYIRSSIAKFENEKFDDKMAEILDAINDVDKWVNFELDILKSIKAFTFPKKIHEENSDVLGANIISNICAKKVKVEKYNNFIDLPIEGHIISVLWILLVGYNIDKGLEKNCFGNRLRDNLVLFDNNISDSPHLFKYYYDQYKSWRNKGLACAKRVLNEENKSIVITMLDINRYYYNIKYTKRKYKDVTKVNEYKSDIGRINLFVYKILKKYSECLGIKKNIILPIGFLPSNILSNAYLTDFDKKISGCKNTVYYGRYVDDMMHITYIEDDKLRKKIEEHGICEVQLYMNELFKKEGIIDHGKKDVLYLTGHKELKFQNNKLRFFYVDKDGFDSTIEKIKSEIAHNTSEFNLIPEDTVTELNKNVLKFESEDTVNKLRSIKSITLDNYTLSRVIGKNIVMSRYAEANAIDEFIKRIDKILSYHEIINKFDLWESVLIYYSINNKMEEIEKFTHNLIKALDIMDEDSCKIKEYKYLLDNKEGIFSVKDSLIKLYVSCLNRSLAFIWGRGIRELSEKIFWLLSNSNVSELLKSDISVDSLINMRKYYFKSLMINKNLIYILTEDYIRHVDLTDSLKNVCINNLDEYIQSDINNNIKLDTKYKPYISTPFDILYTFLINSIKEGKKQLESDVNCLMYACDKYNENFNNNTEKKLDEYIAECKSTDNNDNSIIVKQTLANGDYGRKIRIAVANVKMNENDLEDILDGKKRNISSRCTEISKIVNEAIKYRSNILIMPESYIPISFLPVIQAKAAANKMVIIGGIEHIKYNKLVYNLTVTLIPIVNNKMRYCIPFFHQKVYFSPAEEEFVKKKGYTPATRKGHTLFKYNDISFVTFCCYELTSLEERCKFKREADVVFGVEWNRDVAYFSNILESLSRDRCCFCIQSNTSEYGDSRIVQPTKSISMNIARVKGGINGNVIIGEIDVDALRKYKKKPCKNSEFKPLPAGY